MAAILNSANLHSAILVFPLKLTHTCQDWFPLFPQKNFHSFILTQLDDGSHLEFCHVGIQTLPSCIQTPCFLNWDSLKNILSQFWLWLKLIQSDSNSFILTQLDNGSNLEFCQFAFSHLSFPSQIHSHLPRLWFPLYAQKTSNSFILTQLDDGSHPEFCQVGFRHCHLGFRHLVIFSEIH